jgi:NAD(P)H-hydrate epimerase
MIPLFSTLQIREVDELAINELKVPAIVLMENASLEIYKYIELEREKLNLPKEIALICGKGNNGGDGYAAARHFINNGYKIAVIKIGEEDEMSPDCRINYIILKNLGRNNNKLTLLSYTSINDLKKIKNYPILADAMLGSGIEGNLREPFKSIVDEVNKYNAFKAAIDIPTGLSADRGHSENAFMADITITLGELKKGLFFGSGAVYCGEVFKGSIGIGYPLYDKYETSEYLIEPEDAYKFLPKKKKDDYKYSAGKVFTIAGSGKLPGAAVLTSKAALVSGTGASVLAYPKSVRRLVHKNLGEVIVDSYEDDNNEILTLKNIKELNERIKWADVVAMGPGLGRKKETQEAVLQIIKDKKYKNIVLDADAIFALGEDGYLHYDLKNAVLTPHHAEFAHLIGIQLKELREEILRYGHSFSEASGAYLVLKGAPTIIFTPDGDALINTTGNPGMAKFGTGDVLTGVIASFIAQKKNPEEAITAAVYIHSLSADLLLEKYTEFGYTASDIIRNISSSIKFLRKTFA